MSEGFEKKKVPRVIQKHKADPYTDWNSPWYRITLFYGVFSGAPVYHLVNYTYPLYTQCALAVWSITGVCLWYNYCGTDPLKAKKSWYHFWHCVDKALGKDSFNRLTTGTSWWERLLGRKMSSVYPVDKIYDNGLVRFVNGHWTCYADLHPVKANNDKKMTRQMDIQAVLDGMYYGQMIKINTTQRMNPRKAVINYLLKLSSKITDRVRAQHLNSMIQMLIKKNKTPKVKRHYIMIGLGEHNTYEEALLAKKSKVPSMLENLDFADLYPELLESGEQVEKLLREASCETVVL